MHSLQCFYGTTVELKSGAHKNGDYCKQESSSHVDDVSCCRSHVAGVSILAAVRLGCDAKRAVLFFRARIDAAPRHRRLAVFFSNFFLYVRRATTIQHTASATPLDSSKAEQSFMK